MALALVLGVFLLGATRAEVPNGEPSPDEDLGATPAAYADIPAHLIPLYQDAAAATCPGLPWTVLAGIGKVETDHDRATAVSSAGAMGPMQFLPLTWDAHGVDADGDGTAEVTDVVDAVHGAAAYLCHNGGGDPAQLWGAVWNYNHAAWYVEKVLGHAAAYGPLPDVPPGSAAA